MRMRQLHDTISHKSLAQRLQTVGLPTWSQQHCLPHLHPRQALTVHLRRTLPPSGGLTAWRDQESCWQEHLQLPTRSCRRAPLAFWGPPAQPQQHHKPALHQQQEMSSPLLPLQGPLAAAAGQG